MLGNVTDNDKISLHTFCDTTQDANAAVRFMLVEKESDSIILVLYEQKQVQLQLSVEMSQKIIFRDWNFSQR